MELEHSFWIYNRKQKNENSSENYKQNWKFFTKLKQKNRIGKPSEN